MSSHPLLRLYIDGKPVEDDVVVTRTPFRISFFGGGTDYPDWYRRHGGAVLATTIDKYCYVTCRALPPIYDYRYRIVHAKVECVRDVPAIEHPTVRAILGDAAPDRGLEIHHIGDLQTGQGLGTSSAFTVGLIHALGVLEGRRTAPAELARRAIHVEQRLVRESVGSQDQVCAAFGGFNRIEFQTDGGFRVTPLSFPAERLAELQDRLLLFFTGFSRISSRVAQSTIENLGRHEAELGRMREMVDEAETILADPRAPIGRLGELLDEHWKYKRGLSPLVSTPEIDQMYDAARSAGATGGKLLGAGGGGALLLFVEPDRQKRVREQLGSLVPIPFRFDATGSRAVMGGTGRSPVFTS